MTLASDAHDLRALAETARGYGLLQEGALLGNGIEKGDPDSR
jgi:hypothetical protein